MEILLRYSAHFTDATQHRSLRVGCCFDLSFSHIILILCLSSSKTDGNTRIFKVKCNEKASNCIRLFIRTEKRTFFFYCAVTNHIFCVIFQYWQHKIKHSDVRLAEQCNDECLHKLWCSIVICPT